MVRTLDSALLTALNAVTRSPALTLTIEDHVIHYAPYQTGSTDAWNDGCIASDNSIIRVQLTRGGSGFVSNFQVQRITDPSQAPNGHLDNAAWLNKSHVSGWWLCHLQFLLEPCVLLRNVAQAVTISGSGHQPTMEYPGLAPSAC